MTHPEQLFEQQVWSGVCVL